MATIGVAGCHRPPFKVYTIRPIQFPHEAKVLDNGLKVVIQPDSTQAEVLLTLRFGVGSGFDPKDQAGLAHFVEHLAFRRGDRLVDSKPSPEPAGTSSTTQTASPAKKKSRVVRYLSESNAWTNEDETFYHYAVTPANVTSVLTRYANIMRDFSKDLSPRVFEAERRVVHNERKARYEGTARRGFWIHYHQHYRPSTHPYHASTIGSRESLDRVTLPSVSQFLKSHYHASNAVLTVVGPVDPVSTLASIEKLFAKKAGRPPSVLAKASLQWTPTYREKIVEVDGSDEAVVVVSWPIGRARSDAVIAVQLARDSNSEIWYRLVKRKKLAYALSAWVDDAEEESSFVVVARTQDLDNIDDLKEGILKEVGRLVRVKSKRDYLRARRRFVYEGLYDIEGTLARAEGMSENYRRLGAPLDWVKDFDRVQAMTIESVRKTVPKLLAKDRAFVLIQRPPAGTRSSTKDRKSDSDSSGSTEIKQIHSNRKTLPETYRFDQPFEGYLKWAQSAAAHWADAEEFQLPNGIRCRVARNGDRRVVAVNVHANGGEVVEAVEEHGVADLMTATARLEHYEDWSRGWWMGRHYSFDADSEGVDFSYRFFRFYADEALRIMATHVFSPYFSGKNVDDARRSAIRRLEHKREDVGTLSVRAYWAHRGLDAAFSPATRKTLEEVSRRDVDNFHEDIVYPENLTISMVGAMPIAQMRALLTKHFSEFGAEGKPPISPVASQEGNEQTGRTFILVPSDKGAQSAINFSVRSPGPDDWKGQERAKLASVILRHRIKQLREALGVTYGASVGIRSKLPFSALAVRTTVQRDATADAVDYVLRTVDALSKATLNAGEVDFARRSRIGSIVGADRSAESSAARHTFAMTWKRPLDFDRRRVDYVASISISDLQSTIQSLLTGPSTVVVVGAISDDLEKRIAGWDAKVVRQTPADLTQ